MSTVPIRPNRSARSTARDLRVLMHDQQIATRTLAWILSCSIRRAFALRWGSSSWTLDEVLTLVEVCGPASATVPIWGAFAVARS